MVAVDRNKKIEEKCKAICPYSIFASESILMEDFFGRLIFIYAGKIEGTKGWKNLKCKAIICPLCALTSYFWAKISSCGLFWRPNFMLAWKIEGRKGWKKMRTPFFRVKIWKKVTKGMRAAHFFEKNGALHAWKYDPCNIFGAWVSFSSVWRSVFSKIWSAHIPPFTFLTWKYDPCNIFGACLSFWNVWHPIFGLRNSLRLLISCKGYGNWPMTFRATALDEKISLIANVLFFLQDKGKFKRN